MVRVRFRVRAVLVSLNFLYPRIRVRTAPPVSVRVRNRVSVSFSFSGKLTLLTVGLLNLRTIEPSDYRYRTCIPGSAADNYVNVSISNVEV